MLTANLSLESSKTKVHKRHFLVKTGEYWINKAAGFANCNEFRSSAPPQSVIFCPRSSLQSISCFFPAGLWLLSDRPYSQDLGKCKPTAGMNPTAHFIFSTSRPTARFTVPSSHPPFPLPAAPSGRAAAAGGGGGPAGLPLGSGWQMRSLLPGRAAREPVPCPLPPPDPPPSRRCPASPRHPGTPLRTAEAASGKKKKTNTKTNNHIYYVLGKEKHLKCSSGL